NRGDGAARGGPAGGRGPDSEIVTAVAGWGVNETGAGVVRHVRPIEQRHREAVAVVKAAQWMHGDRIRQRSSLYCVQPFKRGDARLLHHVGGESVGEDEP